MARWVRVPARCLHRIPDSLPFDIACLAEPHAVAYQAMCVNSTIRPGDLVVVLGPGPIGLLCARMAALSGAEPADRGRPVSGRAAARGSRAAWSDANGGHTDGRSRRGGPQLFRHRRRPGLRRVRASRPLGIALGLARPETIVGLRAPLEDWREAFDAMHEGRVIKSVLLPGGLPAA